MKKLFATLIAASSLLAGSVLAQDKPTAPPFAPVTQDIKAPTPKSAYVQDARGIIARNPFGLCWRTGYWTRSACAGAPATGPRPTPCRAATCRSAPRRKS